MAKVFISSICVIMFAARADSCLLPSSITEFVPHVLPAEYVITTVEVIECNSKTLQFTSKDSNFTLRRDGTIVTLNPVTVSSGGRTFSVCALDSGVETEIEVHLVQTPVQRKLAQSKGEDLLKRVKRRWSPPPINVLENRRDLPIELGRLVSDSDVNRKVYYKISGQGVNETPVGFLSINEDTGMLTMLKTIDREEFPILKFLTQVFDSNTREETDKPLEFTVVIDDENDNAPTFTEEMKFTVLEKSNTETEVGTVKATDRDSPATIHTKIKYTLLDGQNLFQIDPETGVITTLVNTLDREVQDKYLVTVEIRDLFGASNGLFNTGTATITLGDINDNPPTFRQTTYKASVKENEKKKEVLRIPVDDKDLANTPNWIAKFVISKGNEGGNFRMDTDPKTNEGLLSVVKPLDFEQTPNVKLEITAQNVAELVGTTATWATVPVDLTVVDEDEGPQFFPPSARLLVKENTKNGTVIGSYTAKDPETKSSQGMKYYKISDPGAWISMDRHSGELKVTNTIDRESKFVQNGLYTIPVKAVDTSSKTGTGTIILEVVDVNDNVPELPRQLVLCETEGELGSVAVEAKDKDGSHFSSPFNFRLGPDHDDNWSLKTVNDTAAILGQVKQLPRGIHKVPLDVKDLQGFGRVQVVDVRICQCRRGVCLAKESSVSFGSLALLALLLPLALLLLLCILLAFFCATKGEKKELDDMADSGGILLKSNTEAPGEEVDSNLIIVPTTVTDGGVKGSVKDVAVNAGWLGNQSSSTMGQGNGYHKMGTYDYNVDQYAYNQFGTSQMGRGHHRMSFDNKQQMHDSALQQAWQANGLFLQQRLGYLAADEEGEYADDTPHLYGYEGAGSVAGSVGCCSDQGADDNLDFLNSLGPKFKTLADACT
ncbi:desmocollin 2-like protein [Genypterus blacodes]|uniref:desmocollin 2-like protein n=1 Tax=Genypterus blacodes TaxID=154954 RepID=UPI003F75D68D